MAGAISLTPEELRSQANVYTSAASSIEAEIQKVSSTNDTIASTWQGQAFNAYLEQFEQLRANVKQMEELLVSVNQQLVAYANTVEERDAADSIIRFLKETNHCQCSMLSAGYFNKIFRSENVPFE